MATKPKGTAVAVKAASGNVVSIMDTLKAQAALMAGRTQPATGSSIRVTQDKQFLLPDGTKTPGPLQMVIVDFTTKNVFYEGAYDPKNISPPACFAIGNDIKGMAPSKSSPLPQAASCESCPMNQFGSAGDGKACKNTRVMAVLVPDADATTPMWLLATSPTANKGFDAYVNSLTRKPLEMIPVGAITTVSFDPSVTYAKLMFSDPELNPLAEVHYARMDEAKAMLGVEPDVSGFVKKPPAKAGRR